MALRIEIISHHRKSLGERGVKEFGVDGGVIGRSLESDWVLQDSERFISSRHASIDFRSGSYYLVDTSTNGVYVNGADHPVGKGKPQRLFDGDRLSMGEYEMLVHIVETNDTAERLADEDHVDPVDEAQHVEAPDPTSYEMVSENEITGVGIHMMLDEEAEESALSAAAESAAANLSLVENEAPTAAGAASAPATDSEEQTESALSGVRVGTDVGLEPFFRGAGLEPRDLDQASTEQLLQRLGQLTRELVVGITEALHIRAEQKNTLRLPHTTIQRRSNNALKFSAGIDESLANLFFKEAPEYMPAVASVREAFHDIRAHQLALLKAMYAALIDYVERMDPEELESKFNRGIKRNALLSAANKIKYWDLYTDLYQVMTRHAPGQFPQLFTEELTRAYEQEVAHLGSKNTRDAERVKSG